MVGSIAGRCQHGRRPHWSDRESHCLKASVLESLTVRRQHWQKVSLFKGNGRKSSSRPHRSKAALVESGALVEANTTATLEGSFTGRRLPWVEDRSSPGRTPYW